MTDIDRDLKVLKLARLMIHEERCSTKGHAYIIPSLRGTICEALDDMIERYKIRFAQKDKND